LIQRVVHRAFRPVLVTLAVLTSLFVACLAYGQTSWPILLWEIPGDYVGWVVAQWDTPECGPLEFRGFALIVPVDASGCV